MFHPGNIEVCSIKDKNTQYTMNDLQRKEGGHMTRRNTMFLAVAAAAFLLSTTLASAVVVTLPDTSQTTTFTANVSEQADVTVPATVTFNVTDVTTTTDATGAVSATSIVLTDLYALKISLQGNAAAFTPPAAGGTTWDVGDVSWAAGTWTNGTGAANTLSNSVYSELATSDDNAPSTSSTVTFTLAAKATADPAVKAGNHTLIATWKFESVGP